MCGRYGIEADFLDESADDEGDVISTDRQDIEWESERTQKLLEWGAKLTRKALRECAEIKGGEIRDWILRDPAIELRVARLDNASKTQVSKFLTILGSSEPDKVKALELGDAIVRAFEYRHFHDVIAHLEAASEDPDKLHELAERLNEWKVLEGRAVLEIIKGRLSVIDKFYQMIVNDAPETASGKSKTNLHDLIGSYPWLLNPDWQVFAEEKGISKQLRDWGIADAGQDASRYDFLALSDRKTLVIIELKRAHYAVTAAEVLRLASYREKLTVGWATSDIRLVLIHGGTVAISEALRQQWERSKDELLTWAEVFHRAKDYYEHYRAIVEGDVSSPDFDLKKTEVIMTKQQLISDEIYRSPIERKRGLGPQDADLDRDRSVGILAFGSLIVDPGAELQAIIEKEIDVITPFEVEYCRFSSKRGGAPTLVRVDSGGAKVKARLLVLKPGVTKGEARDMLWRRETHQVGTAAKPTSNLGGVAISELPTFSGVDYALYASNEVNAPSPDAASLAGAALKSLNDAPSGLDGITYLRSMKVLGIRTPLTDDYEAEVLRLSKAASLEEVLANHTASKLGSKTLPI